MGVAVTGASGFVGAYLVDELLNAGQEVRALRHRNAIPPRDGLEIVDGGLEDTDALARFVDGAEGVIHCAGLVAAQSAEAFHQVNAEGTRRVASAAASAGVRRFLLISSLAARQPQLSAYARSKRAGEVVLSQAQDLAWDALRPPAIYGPGDRQILIFFRLLRHGIGLLPAGETARVSLIHVDDLVKAVRAWLDHPAPTGCIYELCDGCKEGYSWRALIDVAAHELTVKPHYVSPPSALLSLAGHGARAWGRLTDRAPLLTPDKLRELRHSDWACHDDRFQHLTDWRPRIPLIEGLRETIAWYRTRGWL